jgi:hypothetical protein
MSHSDLLATKFGVFQIGAFFNQLQKFHEAEHTRPALQDTFFSWPPGGFNNHVNDAGTTRLHQEQTLLGWSQLFRERFSSQWAITQYIFLLTLVVDRHYYTGDLWVRKLINLLWKSTRTLWDACIIDHHGHTPLQNKQAIRRNRLKAMVHVLYEDSSTLMLAADRDVFALPAAQR